MKNVLKIAAIAALLISTSTFAGGSTSTSTSASGSSAQAGAANGTNYQGVTTINQTSKGVKQDKWVPDATAPGLTTTLTETCMGSTSAGAAISGGGISFGSTWVDESCVRRLDAREMASQGAKVASMERMCDDLDNRAAFLRGHKQYPNTFLCYADTPEGIAEAQAEAAMEVTATVTDTTSAAGWNNDWEDF